MGRQEVSHQPATQTFKRTFSAQVKGTGVKVGVVRPGGIATPGYDHAAGSKQSREVAASLGCWVPADTSGCLQPDVVAAQVVNMVQALDEGADITEVSLVSK